jgi:hypothetical protein
MASYLEGVEKGIQKGREEGVELEKRNFVHTSGPFKSFRLKK